MATWFDITTTGTDQTLPVDTRSGQQLYTVTNASGTLIRGDGLIVPDGEAKAEWFTIAQPSRVYSRDGSEQVPVAISVPAEVAPGVYGYRLRMVVGDGIPEEQFNDGPQSRITVQPVAVEPPAPPPPPKKPFPWWIVAVAIVVVLVLGSIVFILTRPRGLPDLLITNVTLVDDGVGGVNVRVSNIGETSAGPFAVFLSYDGSFPFFPIALVTTVPGLDAHSTTVAAFSPGFVVRETTGRAIVDSGNQVDEANELNNRVELP